MTEDINRPSARVYQFPAGGRAGLGGRRDTVAPAEKFAAPRVTSVSGAWYHDEAIEEETRVRKF
jgi:hypothetical protein